MPRYQEVDGKMVPIEDVPIHRRDSSKEFFGHNVGADSVYFVPSSSSAAGSQDSSSSSTYGGSDSYLIDQRRQAEWAKVNQLVAALESIEKKSKFTRHNPNAEITNILYQIGGHARNLRRLNWYYDDGTIGDLGYKTFQRINYSNELQGRLKNLRELGFDENKINIDIAYAKGTKPYPGITKNQFDEIFRTLSCATSLLSYGGQVPPMLSLQKLKQLAGMEEKRRKRISRRRILGAAGIVTAVYFFPGIVSQINEWTSPDYKQTDTAAPPVATPENEPLSPYQEYRRDFVVNDPVHIRLSQQFGEDSYRTDIAYFQYNMASLGIYQGPIDGQTGPDSRHAARVLCQYMTIANGQLPDAPSWLPRVVESCQVALRDDNHNPNYRYLSYTARYLKMRQSREP